MFKIKSLHEQEGLSGGRIAQLNQAIDIGLTHLAQGKKIAGHISQEKMKTKIKNAVRLKHNV